MKKNFTMGKKDLLLLIIGNGLMVMILSIISPSFLTYGNISSVFLRMSVYGMLGIAETIVFISAGFDLTIGAVMALSGALTGTLYAMGVPFPFAILIALAACAGVGIINAYLIVNLKLSPFIVTLATMSIVQSVVYAILKGRVLTGLPNTFLNLGYVSLFKLPFLFIVLLVTAISVNIVLERTVIGRKIFAVGGNEKTAFISGINVSRVKYSVYILSSLISGIAGLMFVIRIRAVLPEAGLNAPLEIVTAVLIGGTTIYGGKGTVIGSLLGVLIMYLLLNGFNLLALNPFWEVVIFGMILIVIVGQDTLIKPLISKFTFSRGKVTEND